jgi:hypothetical protein
MLSRLRSLFVSRKNRVLLSRRRGFCFERLDPKVLLAGDVGATLSEALSVGPLNPRGTISRAEAVSPETDVDMYQLEVLAGQRVGFDIDTPTNGPPGLGSYLRIFDSQGRQLAYNNDRLAPGDPPPGDNAGSDGFDSYIEYVFATEGTFFVGVSNWQHGRYNPVTGAPALGSDTRWLTGGYSLIIKDRSPPPDPDDQLSEARNLGTLATAEIKRINGITVPWDVDMYQVAVAAGTRVGFDIDTPTNGPGGVGAYLRVFDAAGVQLAANNDGRAPDDQQPLGFDSYLEYTFPQAGTYFVGVSNWQNTRYSATTGIDVMASNPAHLTGPYTLTVRNYTHFITRIPDIMGNLGWDRAQKLQQKWFAAPARTAGPGVAVPIDTNTVKMDWVLGYDRAKSAYDELLNVYANDAAKAVLKRQLESMFARTTATTIAFGNFTKNGSALHQQHVNHREVASGYAYALDELTGALGNFSFYVIPKGTATKTSNGISVTITEVGVYLRDSFDFNGDQNLGHWKTPDGVRATPWVGYTAVNNASYRDYRTATGRGGDFTVYSDVKVTALTQPNTFTL